MGLLKVLLSLLRLVLAGVSVRVPIAGAGLWLGGIRKGLGVRFVFFVAGGVPWLTGMGEMASGSRLLGYGLVVFSLLLIISLVVVKADVDRQSAYLCELTNRNELDMKSCPAHSSNVSWFISAAFVFAALILGLGAYLSFARRRKESPEVVAEARVVDDSMLSEEERFVYGLLKAGSGSKYQSDMIRETGWSKVKVTRVLDRLESRGLVERRRRGMTNVILLK